MLQHVVLLEINGQEPNQKQNTECAFGMFCRLVLRVGRSFPFESVEKNGRLMFVVSVNMFIVWLTGRSWIDMLWV